MATHSSILAWRIPWTEEPLSYSPWGLKESNTTELLTHTHTHTHTHIYTWLYNLLGPAQNENVRHFVQKAEEK